jgi:hypothetical protein
MEAFKKVRLRWEKKLKSLSSVNMSNAAPDIFPSEVK